MSDTPRTDAFDQGHGFAYASEAIKFAERLERENARLRAEKPTADEYERVCTSNHDLEREVAALRKQSEMDTVRFKEMQEAGERLEAETARLREDKDRLDWMEKHYGDFQLRNGKFVFPDSPTGVRDWIDARRAAVTGKETKP